MTNMTDWLPKRDRTAASRCDLYCLPHAGGGSAIYHRWERHLADEVFVQPIKLPGRESRLNQPAIDNIPGMVAALLENVQPHIRSPFILFGHSMGGLIAFEWAQALLANGRTPALLVVSACRSPDRFDHNRRLHQLPDEEMIRSLVHDFGSGSEATDGELQMMRIMSDTIRADLKLLETYDYRSRPPVAIPILAVHASEDQKVSRADVQGWSNHTTGKFTMRTIQGPHFFLREQEKNVISLLKKQIEIAM